MDYETQEMPLKQGKAFQLWFDDEIGTDYDLNTTEEGVYFICLELEPDEVDKIRSWEEKQALKPEKPTEADTLPMVLCIARACLERHKECPDYGGRGKKATDMALNYFIGAAKLAELQDNQKLAGHLRDLVWVISIRGIDEVFDLVEKHSQ